MPPEHRDFILDRFAALGLKAVEISPDSPSRTPYFSGRINQEMVTGVCHVSGMPFDPHENVLIQMGRIGLLRADVIDLYLDMNNKDSLDSYQMLTNTGFFMTGLLLGGREGDYIVMQHLMNNPLICQKVVCEPGYDAVFKYITSHMREEQLK